MPVLLQLHRIFQKQSEALAKWQAAFTGSLSTKRFKIEYLWFPHGRTLSLGLHLYSEITASKLEEKPSHLNR